MSILGQNGGTCSGSFGLLGLGALDSRGGPRRDRCAPVRSTCACHGSAHGAAVRCAGKFCPTMCKAAAGVIPAGSSSSLFFAECTVSGAFFVCNLGSWCTYDGWAASDVNGISSGSCATASGRCCAASPRAAIWTGAPWPCASGEVAWEEDSVAQLSGLCVWLRAALAARWGCPLGELCVWLRAALAARCRCALALAPSCPRALALSPSPPRPCALEPSP